MRVEPPGWDSALIVLSLTLLSTCEVTGEGPPAAREVAAADTGSASPEILDFPFPKL